MITLSASASFGNGGKQFIARITGRHPKYTFGYEFIGKKGGKRNEDCSADVDDPGLYVCRDVNRKGNAEDRFRLVLPAVGDELKIVRIDKDTAMKIAKAMDTGRPFLECVDEDGELVTPRQAEQKLTAQTIDSAVEACWAALQGLPEALAKKALAGLKLRVSPPKVVAGGEVLPPETTPVGVLSDAAQDAGVSEQDLGLTPTPVAPFAVGDVVECLDASDGSHFLGTGMLYTVTDVRTEPSGGIRVGLAGMMKMWEVERFRRPGEGTGRPSC